MALTISSLTEYTLLMNVCIDSLTYITVSPRRLNSPSTDSSLSSIGDHPNLAQLEHLKRFAHTTFTIAIMSDGRKAAFLFPELFHRNCIETSQ